MKPALPLHRSPWRSDGEGLWPSRKLLLENGIEKPFFRASASCGWILHSRKNVAQSSPHVLICGVAPIQLSRCQPKRGPVVRCSFASICASAAQSPLRFRSSFSRRIKSAPWSRMRGTRTTAPSARRPSTSASVDRPCLRKPLSRSQSADRQVEPLDQDAEEGAIELGAASDGGLLEAGDAHAHHARILGRVN